MQQIPRVCGALITIGFFLKWYSVDLFGAKIGFSGFTLAKIGGENYMLFIIPSAGIFSAIQPGRGNHAGSALLTGLFLMIFSPTGSAGAALTRDMGWWICAIAAVAQLATCFMAPKEEIQSPLVKSMMGKPANDTDDESGDDSSEEENTDNSKS